MNKVTVIIPTWNRQHTIKETIKSVLNQTLQPYEILICDDGSDDDTYNVVESFSDKRIRFIDCGRNGRPAIPRNIGIRESKGEWLAFLDSDDVWVPEKLEKQIITMKKSGNYACSTNAIRLVPGKGENGNLLNYNNSVITFKDIVKSNSVVCSSIIINRCLFKDIYGFPEGKEFKAIEDYGLWLKIAAITDIDYICEPLVIYNDDPVNSVRGEENQNFWNQNKRVIDDFLSWSKDENNQDINKRIAKKQRLYASINNILVSSIRFIKHK